jgi:hypothetical protein
MKKIIAFFLFSLFIGQANAQTDTTSSKTLSKAEADAFFTSAFKKKNIINFPIFRAYSYTDKSGTYFVALTESQDTINISKDTINYTIKAFNFKADQTTVLKKWEINDFRLPNIKNKEQEGSIWFWTKYCSFTDIDGDGLVDPVVVYGSFGKEGYSDGRAKILVFYKGQKIAIRHQNSMTDLARKTQVDLTFYKLPAKIQDHIQSIMATMIEKKHAIFPSAYVDKMKAKTLIITN